MQCRRRSWTPRSSGRPKACRAANRVALAPAQSPRSGRPEVLVEHASKAVAALHPPGRERDHVGRLAGSALLQPLVRPGVVVVLDELAQHPLQVTSSEDEQVVEPLPPTRADKPLSD